MAIDIKNWVKKQTVGDRNAKGILLEIADCGDADGFCTYGVSTIAATLEMSTRTVERGLAYLQEKSFISREESEKQSGKFTSKNTQILISEDDWNEILYAREKRRLKQQIHQPSDKMTGGADTVPPADKMTDGQNDGQTICQKPSDKMTGGQFVGLNDSNRNVITTVLKEELKPEESLSPHAPAREENSEDSNKIPERQILGNGRRSGILVAEMLNIQQDPEFLIYASEIVEGLKIRQGTPKRLPNREDWEAKIEDAWHNGFSAAHCLEVYDLLKKIRDHKNGHWMLTPRHWEQNLSEIEKRRREVKQFEKGGKKDGKGDGTGTKTQRRIFKSPDID